LSRERVDISLPAAGKLVLVGAGVLLVALVVLLAAMLSVLSDSREHIVAQDRKINRIVKGADPVLGQVQPVAKDARALIKQGTPFVRDLRATLIPLLRDLRGAQLRSAAQVVARLAGSLDQNGRLVQFVDLGSDLVRGLRDSEFIPRTLRAADVVPEMKLILAQTLDVQRRTLSTQLRTLRIQRRTFRLQRQSRNIQQTTLAIQREALVHIRSIDRKTGGTAPPLPVPAPQR
jgi:hypothetical protein